MAWTPTYTVIDGTAIADNLLAFIMANQADALTWAGGASLKPLKPVTAKITDPTAPMMPSIGVENELEEPQDGPGELIETIYSVTFEIWTESSNPSTVVINAKKYKNAVATLIQECPNDTLTGGAEGLVIEDRLRPIVDMEAVRTLEQENHFFQKITIKAAFKLTAGVLA